MKRVLSLFSKKDKDTKSEKKTEKKLDRGEVSHPKLHAFFLAPASAKADCDAQAEEVFVLEEAELRSGLLSIAPSVGETKCRLNQHTVLSLLTSTYYNGLPLYASSPVINAHTQRALQYICSQLMFGEAPAATRSSVLLRVADAFRACQAEQGRVIDAVYGELSGRDKGLPEQIMDRVVGAYKETVLESTVGEMNPNAWKNGDGSPQAQIPHLMSAYRVAIGERVGLRGVEAAKLDRCRASIDNATASRIEATYKRLFDVDDVVEMIVTDINQQSADAERLIDRRVLTKWAGESQQSEGGFNGYSLFYDEDRPDAYSGKPLESNQYQPFVEPGVVLDLLVHLFLKSK